MKRSITKNKKVSTIEDLAIMTQRGFDEIRGEFTKVHKRIDKLVDEVLAIKLDLEELKKNMVGVVHRFEVRDLDERLHKVEIKLGLTKE